jgi:RNA polymerase sigma-70 factor, ECF subfamily
VTGGGDGRTRSVPAVDALTSLAHSARAGERGALDAFIQSGYEQVWRLCATLVDRQSGDDLTQETFLHAIRALPRFRGDSSARTWLLAIARHTCMDELRGRTRRRRRDDALLSGALVDQSDRPDVTQEIAVADLLARLEANRRAAFVLTQSLGLSYEEAARVCECPPGTIRSRVARARSDLLDLLAQPRPGADRNDTYEGRSSA